MLFFMFKRILQKNSYLFFYRGLKMMTVQTKLQTKPSTNPTPRILPPTNINAGWFAALDRDLGEIPKTQETQETQKTVQKNPLIKNEINRICRECQQHLRQNQDEKFLGEIKTAVSEILELAKETSKTGNAQKLNELQTKFEKFEEKVKKNQSKKEILTCVEELGSQRIRFQQPQVPTMTTVTTTAPPYESQYYGEPNKLKSHNNHMPIETQEKLKIEINEFQEQIKTKAVEFIRSEQDQFDGIMKPSFTKLKTLEDLVNRNNYENEIFHRIFNPLKIEIEKKADEAVRYILKARIKKELAKKTETQKTNPEQKEKSFLSKLQLNSDCDSRSLEDLIKLIDALQECVNSRTITETTFSNPKSRNIINACLSKIKKTNALAFLKNASDDDIKDFLLHLVIAATHRNSFLPNVLSRVKYAQRTDTIEKIIAKIKSQYRPLGQGYFIPPDPKMMTAKGEWKKNELGQKIPHGQVSIRFKNADFCGKCDNGRIVEGTWRPVFTDGGFNTAASYYYNLTEGKPENYRDIVYNFSSYNTDMKPNHRYVGDVKLGTNTPHGQGEYYYPTGEVYRGEFKDGKPCGGSTTNQDGSVYKSVHQDESTERVEYTDVHKNTFTGPMVNFRVENNNRLIDVTGSLHNLSENNQNILQYQLKKKVKSSSGMLFNDLVLDPGCTGKKGIELLQLINSVQKNVNSGQLKPEDFLGETKNDLITEFITGLRNTQALDVLKRGDDQAIKGFLLNLVFAAKHENRLSSMLGSNTQTINIIIKKIQSQLPKA